MQNEKHQDGLRLLGGLKKRFARQKSAWKKSLSKNKKMNNSSTNVHIESTEYTEETECLPAGADNLMMILFEYNEF